MSIKAACLTPERVAPGARLARAVTRADGHILLAPGTELDHERIAQLWERGIEFVYVEVEDRRDDAARAADLSAAEGRVAELFRGPAGEAREALRHAVLAHRRQEAG